ncbi:uncharacterized protein [Anoplolepis gracilipes]
MIIAKTQRLSVTNPSDVNQAKIKTVRLNDVVISEKVLETPGEGYNYTDVMTLVTVKRRTSPIRLPIRESMTLIRLPIRMLSKTPSRLPVTDSTDPDLGNMGVVSSYKQLNDELNEESDGDEPPNPNKFAVLPTLQPPTSTKTTEPTSTEPFSIFPPMSSPSRDYLPSKSLYSYNIDTGIRDQKDDRLNHTDTEQMVQA